MATTGFVTDLMSYSRAVSPTVSIPKGEIKHQKYCQLAIAQSFLKQKCLQPYLGPSTLAQQRLPLPQDIEKPNLYTPKVNNNKSQFGDIAHIQEVGFKARKSRRYAVHTGHKAFEMSSIEFDEDLINLC